MLHQRHPKAPSCFLLVPHLKERISKDKSDRIQPGVKTVRHEKRRSEVSPKTILTPTSSATSKEGLRTPSYEQIKSKQEQARALLTFSDNRILSRKLMFCDKIIAKTDILSQPSLSSPSNEEEEQHRHPLEQEDWGRNS